MKKNIYSTNIEDSVLQARGPFRLNTTSELSSIVIKPIVIEISRPTVLGKIEFFSKTITPNDEKGRESQS